MLTQPTGTHADELFQALVENSSGAIALVDGDGFVRFASASARVLGDARDERGGRRAFELIDRSTFDGRVLDANQALTASRGSPRA